MTPQNTPLEISEEAKATAYRAWQSHESSEETEREIQLAINSATAKLREENEKLKTQIETKKFDYGNDPEMVFHEELGWLHQLQVAAYTELKLRIEELEKEISHHKGLAVVDKLIDEAKEIESLQKQIVGLREAFDNLLIEVAPSLTPELGLALNRFAIAIGTTNFSRLYVRREVLEKLLKAWKDCENNNNISRVWAMKEPFNEAKEALTLARKELE